MVKEAIEPSGSVAPSPAILRTLFGGKLMLALAATGGWFADGSRAVTVAVPGLVRPRSSVALYLKLEPLKLPVD